MIMELYINKWNHAYSIKERILKIPEVLITWYVNTLLTVKTRANKGMFTNYVITKGWGRDYLWINVELYRL